MNAAEVAATVPNTEWRMGRKPFYSHEGLHIMAKRIQKKDAVKRLASRLSADEEFSKKYLDAILETLYEAFKSGEGVTLPNFGSFYLDRRRNDCVLKLFEKTYQGLINVTGE